MLALSARASSALAAAIAPAAPALAALGAAVAAYRALQLSYCLLSSLLWRPVDLRRRFGGRWAVVTGASEGIGLAYATELARKGLHVCLIARSADKLNQAKAHVAAAVPGARVEVVAADLGSAADFAAMRAKLFASLPPDDVGVLVNNVGVAYPTALFFDPRELDKDAPGLRQQIVDVNVVATTEMTSLLLPYMLARGCGCIINISSGVARIPTGAPLYSLYAATKAFVENLSLGLHEEVAARGVHVQCQSPFLVATRISGIRVPTLLSPSPEAYARAAVADIGRGASTVPYLPHFLLDSLIRALPTWLVAAYFRAHHLDLRHRYVLRTKRLAEAEAARALAAATAAPVLEAPAAGAGRGAGGSGKRASSRSRKQS